MGIYHNLVKAQDLAPTETRQTADRISVEDSTQDDTAELDDPLAKIKTAEERNLASLKDREDFENFKQRGLISTVVKLVSCTPDLRLWYLLTVVSCIIGGKLLVAIYPSCEQDRLTIFQPHCFPHKPSSSATYSTSFRHRTWSLGEISSRSCSLSLRSGAWLGTSFWDGPAI